VEAFCIRRRRGAAGGDVLAEWAPGVPTAEYEAVGATWVIDATWPDGDWLPEFGDRVRRGPPV